MEDLARINVDDRINVITQAVRHCEVPNDLPRIQGSQTIGLGFDAFSGLILEDKRIVALAVNIQLTTRMTVISMMRRFIEHKKTALLRYLKSMECNTTRRF